MRNAGSAEGGWELTLRRSLRSARDHLRTNHFCNTPSFGADLGQLRWSLVLTYANEAGEMRAWHAVSKAKAMILAGGTRVEHRAILGGTVGGERATSDVLAPAQFLVIN